MQESVNGNLQLCFPVLFNPLLGFYSDPWKKKKKASLLVTPSLAVFQTLACRYYRGKSKFGPYLSPVQPTFIMKHVCVGSDTYNPAPSCSDILTRLTGRTESKQPRH